MNDSGKHANAKCSADSALTFNILYMRGTVSVLRLFARSLAASSSTYRFRLISNGATAEENRELEALCGESPRLEFDVIAADKPLPHGTALTQLQQREQSPWFAFMDSDIFATGDFEKELEAFRHDHPAVFSCPPVWSNEQHEVLPDDFQVLSGVYNRLHDGFPVGASYFGIYDNAVLSDTLAETGLTLDLYRWDGIPKPIQQEVQAAGRKLFLYDTGKLLNIVMALRGQVGYRAPLANLCHIGGVSCIESRKRRRWPRAGLSKWAGPMIRRLATRLGLHNGWREQVQPDEQQWQDAKTLRRHGVCDHLYELLTHLLYDAPCPELYEHEDAELVREVQHAEWLLVKFCDQYGTTPLVAASDPPQQFRRAA